MKSPFTFAQWTQLALLCLSATSIAKAIPAEPASVRSIDVDASSAPSGPLPEYDVEQVNHTSNNIVRRGCIPSKPSQPNQPVQPGIPLQPVPQPAYICDGNFPSDDEFRAQFRMKGNVGTKISVFYTGWLNEPPPVDNRAIGPSKAWIDAHPEQIPCGGYVFFDEIVDNAWSDAMFFALDTKSRGLGDRFQKYLSQMMAQESAGTVWLFTPKNLNLDQLKRDDEARKLNVWSWWEFPALTRNPRVTQIIRMDPREEMQDTPRVIWTQGQPPSPNLPRGKDF